MGRRSSEAAKLLPLLLPNDSSDPSVGDFLNSDGLTPVREKVGLLYPHHVENPSLFCLRVICADSFEQVVDFLVSLACFRFLGNSWLAGVDLLAAVNLLVGPGHPVRVQGADEFTAIDIECSGDFFVAVVTEQPSALTQT